MNSISRVVLVLSVVVIGNVCGQISNDLEESFNKFRETNGAELDLDKLNKTQLPDIDKVKDVLREKCAARGHEEAVDAIEQSRNTTQQCLERYINVTQVKAELDKAGESGSMDEVFGKYCRMWPDIYGCVEKTADTIRLCMEEKEQKAFNKSLEILSELQEFMCFKDGDRLAMFVAEGGVECVEQKKTEIQNCVNSTIGNRIPQTDELSVGNLPVFLFSDEDCDNFDSIRKCLNTELEKCEDSAPANLVDSFLKFLKKQMPCQSANPEVATPQESKTSGALSSFVLSSSVFIVSLLTVFSY